MTRVQRSYSEDDKASALALLDSNGGNVFRTAKQLGIPRTTLQEWRDGCGVNAEVTTSRQVKKGELSARYESAIHDALDALTPAKLKKAGVKDIATTIGIFTDKMLVLDGEGVPGSIPLPTLTAEQQRRIERLRAVRDERAGGDSDDSAAIH